MNPMFVSGRACRRSSSARRRATVAVPACVEGLESRDLMAAGPLGINVVTLDFVDVMKDTTGDWTPVGQAPLTRDAQGWPTADASILVMDQRVNMPWDGPDPNAVQPDIGGTYHLSFHGQATVDRTWLGNLTVQNQAYDPITNVTTADVVVIHNTYALLYLQFTNTQNRESATGAGVSDVQLLQPGYAPGSTQLYTDDYINALKPFGTLRYLDPISVNNYGPMTNNDGPLDWSQRRLPTDASQSQPEGTKIGVSWEYMIALANQTNTDMWLTVPGTATDDYLTHLAALLRDGDVVDGVAYAGLKPNLKIDLEYSNEVWGGIMNTADHNTNATAAELAAGNTPLNNDGVTDPYTLQLRRYAERTMQIANDFRSVLGPDPTFARVRPVLGLRMDYAQSYLDIFPWFEKSFGAPDKFFYGLGAAIYSTASDTSSPDAVINSLYASEAADAQQMQTYTTVADYYGMKNVSYEGGPGLSGTGQVALNILAASRDPRMEQYVVQHYLDFYAAGGDVANFFNGPYGIWGTQYGIWQAAELSQKDNPSLSPKYRALVDLAAAAPQASNFGFPVSSASPSSLSITSDSMLTNFSANLNTGTQHYWTLNVASAGVYNISLATTASLYNFDGLAPSTVQVLSGDDKVLGTYSVNQSGTSGLGSIALHAGRNLLVIRVVHGLNDPSNSDPYYYDFHPNALTLTYQPPMTSGALPGWFTGSRTSAIGLAKAVADNLALTNAIKGNGTAPVAAPEGTQVGFLQEKGVISQTVSFASAGSYNVVFQAAQRNVSTTDLEDFQVLVDNTVVGTYKPTGTAYQAYQTATIAVSAGTHAITFRGLDTVLGHNAALIDTVQVVGATTDAPTAPTILDSGFEATNLGSAGYLYDPSNTSWTFAGSAGILSTAFIPNVTVAMPAVQTTTSTTTTKAKLAGPPKS